MDLNSNNKSEEINKSENGIKSEKNGKIKENYELKEENNSMDNKLRNNNFSRGNNKSRGNNISRGNNKSRENNKLKDENKSRENNNPKGSNNNNDDNSFISNYKISIKKLLEDWKEKGNLSQKSSLNSKIYEYYCYEKIISDNPQLHIILSKNQEKKYKEGFNYKNGGQIYYTQYGIDLGEFDILGLDDQGTLYWWEVTTSSTMRKIKKKFKQKEELLSKLFNNVKFTVLIPKSFPNIEKEFKTEIVQAPDYENFYQDFYTIQADMSHCWPIEKLREAINKNYDYIQEIISLSKLLFSGQITKYTETNSDLIERLFDLSSFDGKSNIKYFHVERQVYGEIIYKNNKMFKKENNKEKLVKYMDATAYEIRAIKKYLEKEKKKKIIIKLFK